MDGVRKQILNTLAHALVGAGVEFSAANGAADRLIIDFGCENMFAKGMREHRKPPEGVV